MALRPSDLSHSRQLTPGSKHPVGVRPDIGTCWFALPAQLVTSAISRRRLSLANPTSGACPLTAAVSQCSGPNSAAAFYQSSRPRVLQNRSRRAEIISSYEPDRRIEELGETPMKA